MRIAYFLILLFAFAACQPPKNNQGTSSVSVEDSIAAREALFEKTDFLIGNSFKATDPDYLIYPLEIENHSEKKRKTSYSSNNYYENDIVNLVFYNYQTGVTSMLFPAQQVIITNPPYRAENLLIEGNPQGKKSKLFYKVIFEDYTRDGTINRRDPECLFMSYDDGTELVRLSPRDVDVFSWKFLDSTKTQIEIRGLKDTDTIPEFDSEKDRAVILIVDIANPDSAFELFPKPVQDSLKALHIGRFVD